MAASEDVTAQGVSGMKYNFMAYPWGTQFKALGGVYLILKKNWQNAFEKPIYIGQTKDLSERFDEHHKAKCFDRNAKTHIAVMVEESEQRRLAVEADLIKSYNTSCNG
jgi:predicted GIY-YIG superfamily endonuclease